MSGEFSSNMDSYASTYYNEDVVSQMYTYTTPRRAFLHNSFIHTCMHTQLAYTSRIAIYVYIDICIRYVYIYSVCVCVSCSIITAVERICVVNGFRIVGCTVRHPGVEHPLSSLLLSICLKQFSQGLSILLLFVIEENCM